MKNAASSPEIADPYAALEKILKVIGRTWLSEEWRLEDIRLLAQDAIATRGKRAGRRSAAGAAPSLEPQIRFKPEFSSASKRSEQHPS